MNPEVSPALILAGVLAWFALSVIVRKWRGRHFFATRVPEAVFSERWASGRPGSGLFARLSTAKNCLHVQVTPEAVCVEPHFPISLGFVAEAYDMDHHIPLADIQSVTVLGGLRMKTVEVAYQSSGGKGGILYLLLRHAETFQEAVNRSRLEPD
ncbi:hypothetical protein [Leptothrix discophora]|uniref:Uncharacterized protein n=1 Tax=Leptothrix discophora TaxID=89 RepID=A0ABT9G4W5_LEPDI|nr:hypothetical protein [Leptothrix discophora]MDP4301521.1 hypothetical protein [Leptothrix discophora]